MPGKSIAPTLSSKSFTCPHCGAHAHQTWYRIFIHGFSKDQGPRLFGFQEEIDLGDLDEDDKRRVEALGERLKEHAVTYSTHQYSVSSDVEMINTFLSNCYSCKGFAVWIEDSILYPKTNAEVMPHED